MALALWTAWRWSLSWVEYVRHLVQAIEMLTKMILKGFFFLVEGGTLLHIVGLGHFYHTPESFHAILQDKQNLYMLIVSSSIIPHMEDLSMVYMSDRHRKEDRDRRFCSWYLYQNTHELLLSDRSRTMTFYRMCFSKQQLNHRQKEKGGGEKEKQCESEPVLLIKKKKK